MIELRMLGRLELRGSDGRDLVDVLVQPKRFALLAYLAVGLGTFRRRDTLLGMFWPDLDEAHARDALKQAVSQLRRGLAAPGEPAIIGRGAEEIAVSAVAVWSDAAAFIAACDEGRMEHALELYRGDLLDGFISRVHEFDDWLSRERRRMRELACRAAQQCARLAEESGDIAKAVSFAERAAALSDLDERVLQQRVHLLDRAGDRAGAIRAYDTFMRELAAEYGAEPSAETRDLVDRIRARRALNPRDAIPATVELRTAETPPLAASGNRRVPRKTILFAAALALASITGLGYRQLDRRSDSARERVAVVVFDDRTRDTALVGVGRIAAEWLTQGLAQLPTVEAAPVSASVVAGVANPSMSEVVQRVGKAMHALVVVTGSVTRSGDSIQVSADISDAHTNRVIRSINPIAGPASNPLVAINALRERLLGSFASHDRDRRVPFGTQPPNYEAYRAFDAGMTRYWQSDFAGSAALMERSIALDSTFVAPYGALTVTYVQRGDWDNAQRVLDRSKFLRGHLAPSEESHLDFLRARIRGDYAEQLRIERRLLAEEDSTAVTLLRIGTAANALLKPRMAIDALRAIEADMAAVGWQRIYIPLAEAYHEGGDFKSELLALERGRKKFPSNGEFAPRQLVALAGLAQPASARALADTLIAGVASLEGGAFPNVLSGAEEFRALGDSATARQLTRTVLAWFASGSRKLARAREMVVGRAYYDAGVLDSASTHFHRAAADSAGIDVAGYLALIAAREGSAARARATIDSLSAHRPKWDFGMTELWRAAILAQLGDPAQAVQALRRACEQGQSMASWHSDVRLAALWNYPPFKTMVNPER